MTVVFSSCGIKGKAKADVTLYFTTRNSLGMRRVPWQSAEPWVSCHPERSGCFAMRGSHAVEEPAPSEVEGTPIRSTWRQDARDPSTPPAHSLANGLAALR